MTEDGNAVGNAFRTPFETLPHTTPHHTTKNTSSRNMALAADPKNATARIRSLDTLDAAAHTIGTLRPDWALGAIRATLARDKRAWGVVIRVALAAALDPDVRLPARIETYQPSAGAGTPVPPPPEHRRHVIRCVHGGESGLCALCRREGVNT